MSAKTLRWALFASVGAALATSLAGCHGKAPTHAATTSPSSTASAGPAFDPCEGSPPVPRKYTGILRNARCQQEMFLTMAGVAGWLGVECSYCHVADPANPGKELYPPMTPHKQIALWMSNELMDKIKPKDGSRLTCKSCHVDEQGKPLLKILGEPRSIEKATEWMTLVMVNKFTAANGERLRCKSCHTASPGTPQFQGKVINKALPIAAAAQP